jgi:hypothetical protein
MASTTEKKTDLVRPRVKHVKIKGKIQTSLCLIKTLYASKEKK